MDEKIDINRADVETLASLLGIGLKRAAQIVEYRTAVHPFEELIELAAVPGISERMVREITGFITVNGTDGEVAVDSLAHTVEVEGVVVVEPALNGGEPVGAEVPLASTASPEGEAASETADPDEQPREADPDEAELPIIITMPEAVPQPEPPPTPVPTVVERTVVETIQRRHFHLWQQFFGVAAGALLGSLLTLMLLYLLNGTLRFAGESRATGLQLQLDQETSAIRQSQSDLTDEMGQLSGQVTELDNELAVSEEAIEDVEGNIASLEEETAALTQQIETINLTAEKFDAFLTGLRDLLVTLQGLPPGLTTTIITPITTTATAAPTGTVTITVTPDAAVVTLTPTAASPDAGSPTRTPRPTATPFTEIGND